MTGTYRERTQLPQLMRGSRCLYCGDLASGWDHVRPVRWGGSDDPDNLVPACWTCNRRKSDQPVEVWKMSTSERKAWLRSKGWMVRRELPRDPDDRSIAIVNGHRFRVWSDSTQAWFNPVTGRAHTFGWAIKYAAFGDEIDHAL